jgi:hypothetical protein
VKSVTMVPADMRRHMWRSPDGKHYGSFRPNGAVRNCGCQHAQQNPAAWESDEAPLAARIFVGFNVGQKTVWDLDDLVAIVRRVREAQGHHPDASFLAQRGLYTSAVDGKVVEEPGAQVILLDLDSSTQKHFQGEMVSLAEVIATEFEQEAVILELQRGGLTLRTFGIVPEASA